VKLNSDHKEKILASEGLKKLVEGSQALPPDNVKNQMNHDLEVFRKYAQEHFFEKDCRVSHNIGMKTGAQVMLL